MRNPNEKPIFTGAATALVTPMCKDGVDFEALGRLIDWQIERGIDGLVICGTTGESATLSDEEKLQTIAFSVKKSAGRIPIIAGTGSNSTAHAAALTAAACDAGCDAVLVVTPYYNKATQSGLVAHFSAIADASQKPLILYNVPSRTGVSIAPETYVRLAEHPRIAAVKEACGDLSAIAKLFQMAGDSLDVYSGNDDQVVPILSLGGKGVISVLSNVMPGETSRMCHDYLEGRTAQAADAQLKLLPLINALFSQVNPVPVKAAMAAMGLCGETMRLPLTPMEEPMRGKLTALLQEHGLV